ncbi:MAG TPA: hypothetical protein VJB60_01620 [Candidatus Peribacterales bacterium]|nr:hypothetical protein [Candidatus Peribacterales bacterium]
MNNISFKNYLYRIDAISRIKYRQWYDSLRLLIILVPVILAMYLLQPIKVSENIVQKNFRQMHNEKWYCNYYENHCWDESQNSCKGQFVPKPINIPITHPITKLFGIPSDLFSQRGCLYLESSLLNKEKTNTLEVWVYAQEERIEKIDNCEPFQCQESDCPQTPTYKCKIPTQQETCFEMISKDDFLKLELKYNFTCGNDQKKIVEYPIRVLDGYVLLQSSFAPKYYFTLPIVLFLGISGFWWGWLSLTSAIFTLSKSKRRSAGGK